MNLDDYNRFSEIDPQNMLGHIDGLPDQLQTARELGANLPLPAWEGISQVLVSGMGGSAIGGELLSAYLAPNCLVPIFVQRNYWLPEWARGSHTLVIASSHSGNTEETLSSFNQAVERGCRMLAVTTGGKLVEAARQAGAEVWRFNHQGQPRAAVGYSFGLLLAALTRLSLAPNPESELQEAIQAMRAQQNTLRADVPVAANPAKRIAGQLMGRWVSVFGADVLEPVAHRWKTQINELAKAWAQFDTLPEADHNTLAGVVNPEAALARTTALFLRASSYDPRNALRTNLTKKTLMLEGISTDFIDAQGESRLAHLWTTLHFGDYTAYYLAMAYDIDPTPIGAIEGFKREMRAAEED